MQTSINRGRRLLAAVRPYVWSARVGDFAILVTIPMMGFACGIESVTSSTVLAGAELAIASLLMLVHVFALNDWADYDADLRARPLGAPAQASRDSVLLIAVIALGCCVGVLWSLRPPALVPAALVVFASAIYSLPWPMRGKEVLLLSSALHAFCGAGFFLLGLSVAAGSSARWSGVCVFLGLSMAAGHMYQEISDYREDLASHTRTHATVLGPHMALILAQLIFAAAFLALLVMPGGSSSRPFQALAVLAWAVNVTLAVACWRDGVTPDAAERNRSRYRGVYILVGLGLLLRTPAIQQLAGF